MVTPALPILAEIQLAVLTASSITPALASQDMEEKTAKSRVLVGTRVEIANRTSVGIRADLTPATVGTPLAVLIRYTTTPARATLGLVARIVRDLANMAMAA